MKNGLNIYEKAGVWYGNQKPLVRALLPVVSAMALTLLAGCAPSPSEMVEAVNTATPATAAIQATTEAFSHQNPLLLHEIAGNPICSIQSVSGIGVENFPHAIQQDGLVEVLCSGVKEVLKFDYSNLFHSWTNWVNAPDTEVTRLGQMGTELFQIPKDANLVCELNQNVIPLGGYEMVTLGDGTTDQFVAEIVTAGTNSSNSLADAANSVQPFAIEPTVIEGTTDGIVTQGYHGLGLFIRDSVSKALRYVGTLGTSCPVYTKP